MHVENEEQQYKKMTETPVNRLVLTLGLPTTISMLVTNIYNMADTYFVSDLGNSASGAVSVVFALMAIVQAFGFMFGHGAGSSISRHLGSHNIEEARKYASTSFFLGIFAGLCITVFGLIFQNPFMRLLGSTESILPYARDYSRFILLAAPLMVASCIMNNILRYEGKAAYAMIGLVSGGLLNILGDFILVHCLDMGITGAGISTAVSQVIGAIILFVPYARGMVRSRLSIKYFSLQAHRVRSIIFVGFPSMMRQGLNSISVMILNWAATPYGDEAIAAMGIVARIIAFMFCIGLGIGQGFQPVCAFNYGAKRYERVKKAFQFTTLFSIIFLGVIGLFGVFFSEPLVRIFREDANVVAIGSFALKVQAASLVIMPISVCGNMLFQSTGMGGKATFLASTRSGLFFIPVLLFLSRLIGLTGIQISQAVSDFFSCLVTIPMVVKFLRTLPSEQTVV